MSAPPEAESKYEPSLCEHTVGDSDAADAAELNRIYRKLDYRIIPAVWVLYFLTSFHSGAYGNALTMNRESGHTLTNSLNLTAHDTSVASALGYVGIIIFDIPANLVMTKASPQSWLARIVVSVGCVTTCYVALRNAGGLIAIRFLIGTVDAGLWPGLTYYVSLWYPNDRITRRIGYYFTAAQVAVASAGLVSAGCQRLDGHRGYTGWQWLFLIYGCTTIAVGLSMFWWLPDRPLQKPHGKEGAVKTWYRRFFTPIHPLTEAERAVHMKHMEGRYVKNNWTWHGVLSILSDFRAYPIIIMYFGVVGTGFGLAVFGSTIIARNNPNLSSIDVSLLYAPIWLFDLGGILLVTPFADRYKRFRAAFFSGACLVIIAGLFTMTYAHGSWNKYAGLLVTGFGLGPTVPICMSWSAEILGPLHGDSGIAVGAAMVSGFGSLGSVTATYALYRGWPADAARGYEYSNMVLVAMLGVSVVASGVCQLVKDMDGRLYKVDAGVSSE